MPIQLLLKINLNLQSLIQYYNFQRSRNTGYFMGFCKSNFFKFYSIFQYYYFGKNKPKVKLCDFEKLEFKSDITYCMAKSDILNIVT